MKILFACMDCKMKIKIDYRVLRFDQEISKIMNYTCLGNFRSVALPSKRSSAYPKYTWSGHYSL